MALVAQDHQAAVLAVSQAILDRLDDPPAVGELADIAGYSRFHFGRVFTFLFRETPAEFGKRLRMERAAWQLLHSQMNILGIALDAGFSSHEAFTRAFQSLYRVSPSDFRLVGGTRYELSAPSGVHYAATVRPQEVAKLFTEYTMEITIEKREAKRYVAMKHKGAYYEIGSVFEKLMPMAGQLGIPMMGTTAFFYDDPTTTAEADLRSDAGLEVPVGFEIDHPELHVIDVPAGEFAKYTHKGSYRELGDAWGRFMAGVPSTGKKHDGKWDFEEYANDCSKVAEEDLITHMYCSVE